MLSKFESGVHDDAQNLGMCFGLHRLFFDRDRRRIDLTCIACKMYDGRFLRLKRRSAPLLPLRSMVDDGADACEVALRCGASDPSREVVNESDLLLR